MRSFGLAQEGFQGKQNKKRKAVWMIIIIAVLYRLVFIYTREVYNVL